MDFIPKKRDKEAKLADPPILGPTKTEFVFDLKKTVKAASRISYAGGASIRPQPSKARALLVG
jgi:hypothetical protein